MMGDDEENVREDRQARIQWLKKQAADLGLNVTKSAAIDLTYFDCKTFERLFQEYSGRDVRLIATMRKGRLVSLRTARVVNETPESKQKRSEAAKARWANRGNEDDKQVSIE